MFQHRLVALLALLSSQHLAQNDWFDDLSEVARERQKSGDASGGNGSKTRPLQRGEVRLLSWVPSEQRWMGPVAYRSVARSEHRPAIGGMPWRTSRQRAQTQTSEQRHRGEGLTER